MAKRKSSISKVRGGLYETAKLLGDIQALSSGDSKKVSKRIGRRIVGKGTGRLLGKLFK